MFCYYTDSGRVVKRKFVSSLAFVIFIGKLVSQGLSLATGKLLKHITSDLPKVQTRFLSGTMKTLGQQIDAEPVDTHRESVREISSSDTGQTTVT